jgi:hypothetical protein
VNAGDELGIDTGAREPAAGCAADREMSEALNELRVMLSRRPSRKAELARL